MKIEDINFKKELYLLGAYALQVNGYSEEFIVSGNDVAQLIGYTYEPSYECFSATNAIKLNGEVLFAENSRNVSDYRNEVYSYGKCANIEKAIEYLQKFFKNREITIQYKNEKCEEDEVELD